MDHLKKQQCPQCGGPLRFDPKKAKLVCDYCGAETEIEATGEQQASGAASIEGFDFGSLNAQATVEGAEALPIYNCTACGAEVIAPAEQMALTCPYCGNNIVLTDKVSGKLRPDGVIPFRITSKELPDAMTRFYKDKVLLPKNFFSDSRMGKITGVYVPFWVFSGRFSGTLSYNASNSHTYREGDYEVTDTDHYHLTRKVSMEFADVPVDASAKLDDELMDSITPFEMGDVKPFDMRYLAGFTADRFDQASTDVAPRAEKSMRSTAHALADAQAGRGYSTSSRTGGSLRADLKAKYLLFPVYVFEIMHGGKNYHFAVNGQTGKVIGEVPTDKGVSAAYLFKRAIGVCAAVVAFSIVKYFLGR
ncbi:MAG: hypothetical protein E7474_14665 [Ruminococcaceae bacterium]|nr:hypothetical protein [Oscillospiraceae bacterium]